MTSSPLQPNSSDNAAPAGGRLHLSAEQATFHELMNQLTAITLCTHQLRSGLNPSALSTLERIVEGAVTTARRLGAEMNR